jgi:hypothetical protein
MGIQAASIELAKAVRAPRECPHLKIEIWGTRFCGFCQMWAALPGEVVRTDAYFSLTMR